LHEVLLFQESPEFEKVAVFLDVFLGSFDVSWLFPLRVPSVEVEFSRVLPILDLDPSDNSVIVVRLILMILLAGDKIAWIKREEEGVEFIEGDGNMIGCRSRVGEKDGVT